MLTQRDKAKQQSGKFRVTAGPASVEPTQPLLLLFLADQTLALASAKGAWSSSSGQGRGVWLAPLPPCYSLLLGDTWNTGVGFSSEDKSFQVILGKASLP